MFHSDRQTDKVNYRNSCAVQTSNVQLFQSIFISDILKSLPASGEDILYMSRPKGEGYHFNMDIKSGRRKLGRIINICIIEPGYRDHSVHFILLMHFNS